MGHKMQKNAWKLQKSNQKLMQFMCLIPKLHKL